MTPEQAQAAAAAIPDALYDKVAKAYTDLMASWAIENAPDEIKAEALQRAAIFAGISEPEGRPFRPPKADALLD